MSKNMYVYIMMSEKDGPMYVGVTNNLVRRVREHKDGNNAGFTHKYKVTKLVYFEHCESPIAAIAREKQLKNWHRDWKLNLVFKLNPELKDLSKEIDV